jgi:uncharacterized protein YcbK (DUF882 family)
MITMSDAAWDAMASRGFSKSESWGDPYRMDRALISGLADLRERIRQDVPGVKIMIHCGWESRSTGGYHPKGQAVDLHATGIGVVDFFLYAERIGAFGGIGLYPKWNHPGLHLDTGEQGRRWVCLDAGRYFPLNAAALKKIL